MPHTHEIERRTTSGYTMLAVGLVLLAIAVVCVLNVNAVGPRVLLIGLPIALLGAFVFAGLYMLQPNEAALLLLFGACAHTTWPASGSRSTTSAATR